MTEHTEKVRRHIKTGYQTQTVRIRTAGHVTGRLRSHEHLLGHGLPDIELPKQVKLRQLGRQRTRITN